MEGFSREVSGGGNNIYNLMSNNEKEVAKCLNKNLNVWDRQTEFNGYKFVTNRTNSYPDIFFRNSNDVDIFGLEVKSWNILRSQSPSIDHKSICKEIQKRKDDILVIVLGFWKK